jgi:hypothetical protein
MVPTPALKLRYKKKRYQTIFRRHLRPRTPSSSVVQPARLSSSAFSAVITPHDGLQTDTGNTSDIFMISGDQEKVPICLDRSLINFERRPGCYRSRFIVGTEDDILVQFSHLWIRVTTHGRWWILNRVIGYGMSVAAVSAIIRRRRFAMDGLCDWLETCILEYLDV